MMKDFTNLYEVTKTVRFELKPSNISRQYTSSEDTGYIERTKNLAENYKKIIELFSELVFQKDEDENKYLNAKISIKHSWLKNYTKKEFHEVKDKLITYNNKGIKKANQVSLSNENVSFLFEYFENWIERNSKSVENLDGFLKRPEESQKRISDLAYYIHQVLMRSNFEFIFQLFVRDNIQDKTSVDNIKSITDKIEKCKVVLEELEEILLPNQSMGKVIEKASLNYFTVNKRKKNYSEEIQKLKSKLDEKLFNFHIQKPNQELENILRAEITKLNDDNFVEANFNGENKLLKQWNYLNIKSAYKFLKEYKAKQKSLFYEFIEQGKSKEEIEKAIPLLKCELTKFNQIKNLTKNILVKNKKNESAKDLAQKRGLHFDVQKDYGKFCSFDLYKEICELFGKISRKFGDSKAKIKSLEKEQIDAERVQSWALIFEKDNQKYLCTIPRDGGDNLSKAKIFVDAIQEAKDKDWGLYTFESLTLRALEKLCFGYDKNNEFPNEENSEKKNTFMPEIEKEINDLDYVERVKENYQKFEYLKSKEKEKKIIKFYQKVLGLNVTKKMLSISNFIEFEAKVLKTKYDSLKCFEKALKESYYFKKIISISENTKNQLIGGYQGNFYKITSYDLEKNDSEVLAKLESKKQLDRKNPEKHTQIWLDFWTSENRGKYYSTRLNPELKISFVKAPDELVGKNREKRDLGKLGKNRKNTDRYLLSTTITEKALEEKVDLAFGTRDDIKKVIDDYNKNFTKGRNPFDICYYGLDRGQKELLTLGVFKFSQNEKIKFTKQDGSSDEYYEPLPQSLDIWELKLEKYLEKTEGGTESYKNVSYVLKNEEFVVKKKNQYCVDLSCAKRIKDKIMLNGDIATYLELKRVSALRKIWEGHSKLTFRSENICFNADKQALFLNIENKGKLENENLYFFDERFESILSLEDIKEELQKYFDNLKSENAEIDIIPIEKINNLRDALCANAVGILNYLQEKHAGMMFFEDLDEGNKNKRISEFSGNLASRIEWKLLQKFRSQNLVPPTYKQVMNLQSKKEIDQLGIIGYIKTSGTSSDCPHCGTRNSDKSMKWSSHHYKCINTNCNFDTSQNSRRRGLDFCDNSDSVASYSIAKRGLEFIQKKM